MTLFNSRLFGCAALIAATASVHSTAGWAAEPVIKPDLFAAEAMRAPHRIVECKLTNGETARCYQFEIKYLPDGLETGPFCPRTVNEAGGLWVWSGENSGLYRLNGAFWSMLDTLGYSFTKPDGSVNVEDPVAAGPPTGVPQKQSANYCLEARPDPGVHASVQIPVVPAKLKSPTELGTVGFVGLALDGVPIFSDAPTVPATGNLPAIDNCGGHFDPSGYFHWHQVSSDMKSLLETHDIDGHCHLPQSASAIFGFAYDGYPIYGTTESDGEKPKDLDACNGHFGPTVEYPDGVYHYHASDKPHNLPPCLTGATSEIPFRTNAAFGAGSAHSGGGPGGPPPGARGARPHSHGHFMPPPPGKVPKQPQ